MSIEASMVGYYAERASEYERIYHKPERQLDLQRLRSFVESTFASNDVCEVACGTGYWTEILAHSAASVFATDINEEVLAIARSKRMGQRVTFQREDAYALPLPSQRFTAGLSELEAARFPARFSPHFVARSTSRVHRQCLRGGQQHTDLTHG